MSCEARPKPMPAKSGLSRPARATLSGATLLVYVPMSSALGGRRRFTVCEVERADGRRVLAWTAARIGPNGRERLRLRERESGGGRGNPIAVPKLAIWLILPVVICLSQRLSHAGVSTS